MKTFLIVILSISSIQAFGQSDFQETILTNHSSDDRYASYSPTGEQIIFESNRDENWEIYLMDADGQNQRRLTTNDSSERRPSWHPNGQEIVFESDRNGSYELYNLNIKTGTLKSIEIENLDGEPIFARYSPDGAMIAFSDKLSDEESNIKVVPSGGGEARFITNYSWRSFYPAWSADGKTLLFFSRHETNNEDDEIYTINIDGTNKHRLTYWPKHNFCPAWSNDNKKIVYVTSMEGIRPEIYIMDADGKNQTRITNNEDGDTLPNWSPSSDKLLITGYRNGNFEICELVPKE